MDRQKLRVTKTIDGFNHSLNRPGNNIDGIYRPTSRPSGVKPLPALRPRPIPYPSTSPVLKPQAAVQPGLNRPAPTRSPLAPIQGFSAPLPRAVNLATQPSLLGAALPIAKLNQTTPQVSAKIKKWTRKRIIKTIGLTAAGSALIIGGWLGYGLVGNINKVFHGNVFTDAHALIGGSTLKETNGRINILLAGDSVDDPGHPGGALADSIMVVSIDPTTKTGFMLSIPRDLWVHVGTLGYQKINTANIVTRFDQSGYPRGGMGELQKIVENKLGIPIDYEALIDYSAFKDAVNAVGGITINVQSPDPRGIYDAYTRLKLPNGIVNLTGQQALNLARARGDNIAGDVSYGLPNSDFSRTEHQRQMLAALFSKATSAGVLSNPIKITSLFNAFGSNVTTNLALGDVISLIRVTGGINVTKLQSVTYSYGGNGLLKNYTDPKSGQESLIPSLGIDNYSQIQQFYQQLTSDNPIVQEAPTVTILNGSNVVGLAGKEKKLLEAQGFNVVSIADAAKEYPTTLLVDNSQAQKPVADQNLKKSLTATVTPQVTTSPSSSPEAGEAANYTTNFTLILGQDWDSSKLAQSN